MTTARGRTRRAACAALGMLALLGGTRVAAQGTDPSAGAVQRAAVGARPLSLDEALRMAQGASEQVAIARAGITRARGQQMQAQSQRLPQLNGSASYSRTLKSQFSGLGGTAVVDSTAPTNCPTTRFKPSPALPLDARVDSLEHALECAGSGNPFAGLSQAGFGSANTYNLGLNLQQNLFSGGRVSALNRIAQVGRTTAEIGLTSAQAQLVLDVTQAYYDAELSDRLVGIAEAALAQADETLRQTELGRRVGNQPEFDVLRASVARDNQRPVVIQRRSDRDQAYLRLKQLLNLPLDQPLALTSSLGEADSVVAQTPQARLADEDTVTEQRAAVRQAAAAVTVQEQQLRITRSQRLPAIVLQSAYGRVAFPENFVPSFSDFRSNWTVGAALSIPIFTGGRIRGEELVAQANVAQARAQLQQTRELAQLDTRSALERLATARASFQASAGTARQAARAYQIAEVRYREGISTQLELNDARLSLQQAQANQALAARDLQIAEARVRLLRDLPLSTGAASAAAMQQQTTTTQSTGTSQQTSGATQQTTSTQGALP
ncbi:MAG TPA: TolC family protein [Longimicrobiaceae bacterium]|nr:TolC family protein [Longimicrobiaceae bacterium]